MMVSSPAEDEQKERVHTLMEIAHVDDEAATSLLKACGWSVEEALTLHFAGGAGADSTDVGPSAAAGPASAITTTSGNDFLGPSRPVEDLDQASPDEAQASPTTTTDGEAVGWFGSITRRLTDVSQAVFGVASEDFQGWFEARYGQPTPSFALESFGDASKRALASGKLLMLWFHQEESPATEAMCRNILQNEMVVEILSRNFLLWGGDVCRFEPGTLARLLDVRIFPTLVICQPIRSSLEDFTGARVALEWPLGNFSKPLVSLSPPAAGEEILLDEALAAITSIAEDHQGELQAREAQSIARNMQFEEDRRLREEQDREYEEALLADQLRAIQAAEEASKTDPSPSVAGAPSSSPSETTSVIDGGGSKEQVGGSTASTAPGVPDASSEATKKAEEEAEMERLKKGAEISARPEPVANAGPIAKLMLRLPSGERLQRSFAASDTMAEVYDWAHCCRSRAEPWDFELWTNFPARGLTDRSATLAHLGLVPSAALMLKAVDS